MASYHLAAFAALFIASISVVNGFVAPTTTASRVNNVPSYMADTAVADDIAIAAENIR